MKFKEFIKENYKFIILMILIGVFASILGINKIIF